MTAPRIPGNADEITAAWMQQALAAGAASRFGPITQLLLERMERPGLLAEVARCHLRYRRQEPAAPQTVIVKLLPTSANGRNRRLGRRLALYRREWDFYRLVAPDAPVRSPTLLYGRFEARTNRFVLALEDLRGMEQVCQREGASAEQARRALRALAYLHGAFWNRVDRPPLIGLYDTLAAKRRAWLQLAYAGYLAPALARFGSFFSEEMRALATAYIPRVADHIGQIAAGPRTFIHGDYRLDNIFFARQPASAEDAPARAGGADGVADGVAVIDWQVSGLGTPMYDAAYFLGSSVTTEVRRRVERDALEEYSAIVCEMGATGFSFEACWQLYRHCTLGRLLSLAWVCGGLDLGDAPTRRLAEVGLRRALAAIEDLDAGACMPGKARWWSAPRAVGAVSRGVYRVMKGLQ